VTEKASLHDPFAKLRRAHHHLEALYGEFNRSVGLKTHTLAVEEGKEPRTYILKARNLPDLPPDWGLILGDFANNLRSALDHLVWQLVILSGARPGRHNQFPICLREARYWGSKKDGIRSVREHRLKGVDEDYRTPIDTVQPYLRGRDPHLSMLAGLRDLSNFDKHQVIQAAFRMLLEPKPEHFEVISSDENAAVEVTAMPWQRLENEAAVCQVRIISSAPDAKVGIRSDLPIGIGFGEIGIRIDGLGPLYEFVRDFLKSFTAVLGDPLR
jgi:hypothetical protein